MNGRAKIKRRCENVEKIAADYFKASEDLAKKAVEALKTATKLREVASKLSDAQCDEITKNEPDEDMN